MPEGKRATATAATRAAIIDAARDLLAISRLSDFTLESVAAAAGVTRVTVYNQVGSKHGLVDAVLTELTERWGMQALLTATDAMPATDARAFIVDRTCRFWHAERVVLRPLFGLAAVDHELAANLAQRERWRSDQFTRLLTRLAADRPTTTSRMTGPATATPAGDRATASLAATAGTTTGDRATASLAATAGTTGTTAATLAGIVAVTSFPTYDALGPLADDPAAATQLILRLVVFLTDDPELPEPEAAPMR